MIFNLDLDPVVFIYVQYSVFSIRYEISSGDNIKERERERQGYRMNSRME